MIRKFKRAALRAAVVVAPVAAAVSAHAQSSSPDPTSIYSGVSAPWAASLTIAITAIGAGAVIMYIRKGLKAKA